MISALFRVFTWSKRRSPVECDPESQALRRISDTSSQLSFVRGDERLKQHRGVHACSRVRAVRNRARCACSRCTATASAEWCWRRTWPARLRAFAHWIASRRAFSVEERGVRASSGAEVWPCARRRRAAARRTRPRTRDFPHHTSG